jgi:hypothetical protein
MLSIEKHGRNAQVLIFWQLLIAGFQTIKFSGTMKVCPTVTFSE